MEKIRVNMTPCEEVKTIHASQNDNATRKWAFDLYDENGKIDSSSIKEQMIFDSRVGGTEQILPENGSDPTTSPIIADIQYPDSLRSEQTFLYRESPTTVNGQSKITHIKGNTVVFNQLLPVSSANNSRNGVALNSNNNGSYTLSGTWATGYTGDMNMYNGIVDFDLISGHKYLISSSSKYVGLYFWKNGETNINSGIVLMTAQRKIYTAPQTAQFRQCYQFAQELKNVSSAVTINETVYFMFIDLTQMGLDTLTVDQFTSLYPLPYYAYTLGKLLPFKGEELKTTGSNILKPVFANRTTGGVTFTANSDGSVTINGKKTSSSGVYTSAITIANVVAQNPQRLQAGTYTIKAPSNANTYVIIYIVSDESTQLDSHRTYGTDTTFTLTESHYIWTRVYATGNTNTEFDNVIIYPALYIGDTAPSEWKPYEESTLSLPILDHFPSGMKSLPNGRYDESTENKATVRIGSITYDGTQTITASYISSVRCKAFFAAPNVLPTTVTDQIDNSVVSSYLLPSSNALTQAGEPGVHRRASGASQICISLGVDAYNSGITTEALFLQYLADHPLTVYYELATPTETDITTASLVTEKGETPLYYDDELIADCNETISSESGIFDAKIKLMDDETIYSQKIQLHVERKPQ